MRRHLEILATALLAACLFLSWRLYAQIHDQGATPPKLTLQGLAPQELQMLRGDLRRQKQKLIGENLPMTESQAVKFWAAYQKYSSELEGLNDEKFAMLHSYTQNWRSMSNDDAMIFMRRWLELDENALPGRKAPTFFQLDERINMMINLEFASQLPLLHGARPHEAAGSSTP